MREVHDQLGNDNRYTTTLKTIQLMTEKRVAEARRTLPGSHVYRAAIPAGEQTQREIAGDLLKRCVWRVRRVA